MVKDLLFPWRKEVPDEFGRIYPRLILRTATVLFDMVLINLVLAPMSSYIHKWFIDPKLTSNLQQAIASKAQGESTDPANIISYFEWKKLLLESGLLKQYINYNLFMAALVWLIVVTCWNKFGTTPAKWMMNLKIVDFKTGKRPSRKQFLIRGFMVIFSILPLGLGYLWVISDKYKRTWHDLASGTVVIKNKPRQAATKVTT